MCWTVLAMLLPSVLVGWLAQSWKRQTGALWGLITFVLEVGALLILYVARFARSPRLSRLSPLAWRPWMVWGIAAALGVGLVMALVVATLPMAAGEGGDEL